MSSNQKVKTLPRYISESVEKTQKCKKIRAHHHPAVLNVGNALYLKVCVQGLIFRVALLVSGMGLQVTRPDAKLLGH